MTDTSVKKVNAATSPHGDMGQVYLASGVNLAMRMWREEQPGEAKPETQRPYETIGYVLEGKAELHLEGQLLILQPGDSWVVPKEASHTYRILEPFSAIEVTSPPARVRNRDAV
ncbi:MAG TPA: cupin domain-containing protein [Leptolyngbyaceae cyanobacterium]